MDFIGPSSCRDLKVEKYLFNEAVIKKFIEIYKEEECLWKIKSEAYKNREMKTAAYERLICFLSEHGIAADREFVVKKINALRSCWRKQFRKVVETKNKFKPNLWYYNLFDFIADQKWELMESEDNKDHKPIKKIKLSKIEKIETENFVFDPDNPPLDAETQVLFDVLEEDNDKEVTRESIQSVESTQSRDSAQSRESIQSSESSKYKNKRELESKSILHEELHILPHRSWYGNKYKNITDEFDAFGQVVATKLRKIGSENELQQLFCEDLINKALFNALLEKLTENSKIVC